MTRQLVLRDEAFAHIAKAFLWYRRQRPGLDVHRGLRRALLQRFPYAVYYLLPPSEIEVRAVLHTIGTPGHGGRKREA